VSLPVLIGLHGRRGSGKDTAFAHIAEWAEGRGLTCVRRGFADKLKHSAFLALGFQIAESDALVLADDLKTMGEITTVIPQQSVIYTISGRKFLQLFGTESHRDLFGDNFWVDALLPDGFINAWPKDFDGPLLPFKRRLADAGEARIGDEPHKSKGFAGMRASVRRSIGMR